MTVLVNFVLFFALDLFLSSNTIMIANTIVLSLSADTVGRIAMLSWVVGLVEAISLYQVK